MLGMPDQNEMLMNALRGVIDPELGGNIVDLGMVRTAEIDENGNAEVSVALTIAGCPLRAQLKRDISTVAKSVSGVISVHVTMGEMTSEEKRELMLRARKHSQNDIALASIPPSTPVLAIASGKGGVGKSSVTANLAAAIAQQGYNVGVLDADISGFSIPHLLGVESKIVAQNGKMIPATRMFGTHDVRVISMGLIDGSSEDEAVMLRGFMLRRALQHFLEDVHWNSPDYLLIDMPPGTSDIQMGLSQMLPRANLLVVTTPGTAAQNVAARAIDMAKRSHLRVAGVVENMSVFRCNHGDAYELFGSGGGEVLAGQSGVPLLAQLPLDMALTHASDKREPVVALAPESASAIAFCELAQSVTTTVAPRTDMSACSTQIMNALDAL